MRSFLFVFVVVASFTALGASVICDANRQNCRYQTLLERLKELLSNVILQTTTAPASRTPTTRTSTTTIPTTKATITVAFSPTVTSRYAASSTTKSSTSTFEANKTTSEESIMFSTTTSEPRFSSSKVISTSEYPRTSTFSSISTVYEPSTLISETIIGTSSPPLKAPTQVCSSASDLITSEKLYLTTVCLVQVSASFWHQKQNCLSKNMTIFELTHENIDAFYDSALSILVELDGQEVWITSAEAECSVLSYEIASDLLELTGQSCYQKKWSLCNYKKP